MKTIFVSFITGLALIVSLSGCAYHATMEEIVESRSQNQTGLATQVHPSAISNVYFYPLPMHVTTP